MKIFPGIAALLMVLVGCSGERGESSGESVFGAEEEPSAETRILTEEERAADARRIQELTALGANMEESPWVVRAQSMVYSGSGDGLSDELAEQLRVGQIAFAYLKNINFRLNDNLKILVERRGDIATVTVENPVLRRRLWRSLTVGYTVKVTLNARTGEVISALSG